MSKIAVNEITDEQGSGRPSFTNGVQTSNINGGQVGGRRNLIINGNFIVSQRGDFTSTTNLPSFDGYFLDRWAFRSVDANGTLIHSTRKIRIEANQTTSSGQVRLKQKIEPQNILPDTTYTLSALVKSNKDAKLIIYDDETSAAGDTNTFFSAHSGSGEFEKLSVTMTTRSQEPNEFVCQISFTNGNGAINSGDYIEIREVQLEVGDTATEFEHRSIGEELALCQRYYQSEEGVDYWTTLNRSTDNREKRVNVFFKQTMRAIPSLSLGLSGGVVSSVSEAYLDGFNVGVQTDGDGRNVQVRTYEADAEL